MARAVEKIDTFTIPEGCRRRVYRPDATLRKAEPWCQLGRWERAKRSRGRCSDGGSAANRRRVKLKRLCDAIGNGISDLADPMLTDRVAELKAIRDQARVDAERAEDAIERSGPTIITPQALKT